MDADYIEVLKKGSHERFDIGLVKPIPPAGRVALKKWGQGGEKKFKLIVKIVHALAFPDRMAGPEYRLEIDNEKATDILDGMKDMFSEEYKTAFRIGPKMIQSDPIHGGN